MKSEVLYDHQRVGKYVTTIRGRSSKVRKYHMEPDEAGKLCAKWIKDIEDVPSSIRKLAHSTFFNPYKKGIYYAQLQALYLLGANQWHELSIIIPKVQEIMEDIKITKRDKGEIFTTNAWKMFLEKSPNPDSHTNKDIIGRMKENFIFMQRLSGLYPSGYKLRQVQAALDYKRVAADGMPNGIWYYRLSTYDSVEKSLPIRDFSEFDISEDNKKYVNNKFIGTVITMGKVK